MLLFSNLTSKIFRPKSNNYKNRKFRQKYDSLTHRYLSYIFSEGEWTPDFNIPFGEKYETAFEGKIKIKQTED
jgi:hypothetical protein